MNYVQLKAVDSGNEAHFGLIENYLDSFELYEGMELKDTFPADASFVMDRDYPNAVALADVLFTLGDLLVVNGKVRSLLEAWPVKGLEFLPANIVNHKGRKVKEECFVINILDIVDCIDRKKTKYTPNALDPDEMTDVSNLVVDETKIDKKVELFRTKGIPVLMVATRKLAEHLLKSKVTGLGLAELAEFTW